MGSPWIRGAVYFSTGFNHLLMGSVICMYYSPTKLTEFTFILKCLCTIVNSTWEEWLVFTRKRLEYNHLRSLPIWIFLWSWPSRCSVRCQFVQAIGITGGSLESNTCTLLLKSFHAKLLMHVMQGSTVISIRSQICKILYSSILWLIPSPWMC